MEDGEFMIMLVESVPISKRGLKKSIISLEDKIILGMKVVIMTVPIPEKLHKWQERRLKKRIYELLNKLRINTICLKQGFPYPEWFKGCRSIDGRELIRRILGRIAINNARNFDSVYVHVNGYDRNSFNAITELCQKFRLIMLSAKNNEIADGLYKAYGVSVIVDPTPERIMTADAAVFFDEAYEMPVFKDECNVIKADDSFDIEFGHTSGERIWIPDGYPQIPLISEAILRGCIGFENICIIKSEISP